MSDIVFYKPHIRIKIFADIPSKDVKEFYPPIIINRYPDDLEVNLTIERNLITGNFAWTLLLDVVNLNTFIKWQLLNKKYRYMIVYAGYLGLDYYKVPEDERDSFIESKLKVIYMGSMLWMGTIVDARKKVTTRFLSVQNPSESLTGYTEALTIRYDAGYNLYQLINDIVRTHNNPNVKLNISDSLYEEFTKTKITYSEFNRKTFNDVLSLYGIQISYGDDHSYSLGDEMLSYEKLTENYYINLNSEQVAPTKDNSTLVTENTGLIDIPTLQMEGEYPVVRFKMLFDWRIKPFDYVKLKNSDIQLPIVSSSTDVKNFNSGIYLDTTSTDSGYGYYLVLKIVYSLDSRGENFVQEIEASPYNIYNRIIGEKRNATNTTNEQS